MLTFKLKVLMLIVGAVVFIIAGYVLFLVRMSKKSTSLVEVNAKIISLNGLYPDGASQPRFRSIEMLYEYSFDGLVYRGRRYGYADDVGFFGYSQREHEDLLVKRKEGKTISVYVDPSSPSWSVVRKNVRAGEFAFSVGLLVILLTAFICLSSVSW